MSSNIVNPIIGFPLTKAEISKIHTQNTDTKLDEGGANEVSAAKINWMFTTKTITTAISGEVVIDPADGHRQEATVDGNITSLTCALSEATPSVVLELTAEAAYTLDLTGWETDEGVPFDLKSGKSILLLSLSADGVTKYAFLVGQEVA